MKRNFRKNEDGLASVIGFAFLLRASTIQASLTALGLASVARSNKVATKQSGWARDCRASLRSLAMTPAVGRTLFTVNPVSRAFPPSRPGQVRASSLVSRLGVGSLSLFALLLGGCLRDNSAECLPTENGKAIVFTPAVGGQTRAAAGSLVESGAGIPSGGEFGAYAYCKINPTASVEPYSTLQNQKVAYDGTKFIYTPVAQWPAPAAAQLAFYGYYPWQDQTATPAAGDPVIRATMGATDSPSMTIAYTTPADPSKQVDLMYAYTGLTSGYAPVNLAFGHALTRVNFAARVKDFDDPIVITKITIKDVLTKGTLTVLNSATPVWSGQNTAADMSLTPTNGLRAGYVLTGTLTSLMTTTGADMLVVPQTVTGMVVEVEATKAGTAFGQTFTFPLVYSTPWVMNRIVTYDITISGDGMSLEESAVPWNENAVSIIHDGQWWMSVNKDQHQFSQTGGAFTMNAETNYTIDNRGYPAGLQIKSTEVVYTNGTGWLTVAGGANGDLLRDLTLTATANTTNMLRTAKVYIKAGNMSKVVNVRQLPTINGGGTLPPITQTYVGAFWKVAQTGERVIKIDVGSNGDMTGDWSAYVYWTSGDWAADDISLAAGGSSDGTIYNTATGDPENFRVPGNATFISGTVAPGGSILFRIGLNSKWSDQDGYNSDTKPARYAIIALSYANNTASYKIFLRQGHEPDFLFRTQDNNSADNITTEWGGTAANPRPLVKKISPYNLTVEEYRTGSSSANYIVVTGKGTFTDYPTQTGAFFMWATNTTPRAFHPTYPGPTLTGWNYSAQTTAYWNALKATQEKCPTGYRRLTQGNITNSAAVSTTAIINPANQEWGQSVYLDPPTIFTLQHTTNNIIYGYYADGFFDRRPIVTSVTGIANSTVSPNALNVAYAGYLYFNPYNSGSLFIAATGYRADASNVDNDSTLAGCGNAIRYWSATTSTTTTANAVFLGHSGRLNSVSQQDGARTKYGMPIRCVVE